MKDDCIFFRTCELPDLSSCCNAELKHGICSTCKEHADDSCPCEEYTTDHTADDKYDESREPGPGEINSYIKSRNQ